MLREIRLLRESFDISTASIRLPDRPSQQMSPDERAEADATFYVTRAGIRGAIAALLAEFVPLGSHNCPYDRSSRPDASGWYDLDHLVRALRAEFRRVTVLPSPPKCGELLLCER